MWETDTILKLYKDSVPISTTYTGTVSSIYNNAGTPLHIGKSTYDATRAFDGVIDEVRIYDRAFSAIEIRQLYGRSR